MRSPRATRHPHDHLLVRGADGTYTMTENAGHTHTIDSVALAAAVMVCVQKSNIQEIDNVTPEQIAAMKAENEKLKKMAEQDREAGADYQAVSGAPHVFRRYREGREPGQVSGQDARQSRRHDC